MRHAGVGKAVRATMSLSTPHRLPSHIGFIPDGNRRWAVERGLAKQEGYAHGIAPGVALYEQCLSLGIGEISIYGFTQDNTRRASIQKESFSKACVDFAVEMQQRNAALMVLGDHASAQFPRELKPFIRRQSSGMKVNLLVNYGWEWDLDGLRSGELHSQEIPRMDLIVRWGGGRRLSGFLPVQSVYADIFVIDEYWPDYSPNHLHEALRWFAKQDRTLGG